MFVTEADLADFTLPQVLIIGAGAAGITLATQLGRGGVRVLLVEAGGLELTPESQQLYDGTFDALPYSLSGSRLRFFGGTTNHWTGWTRPLDVDTFTARPGYPGWPLAKTDLDPYLPTALEIIDMDPNVAWQPTPDQNTEASLRPYLAEFGLEEVFWHWSAPPTRFANKFHAELDASTNVFVLLNHALVDLTATSDGQITAATFRKLAGGDPLTLTAQQFVLACGGIENARLLQSINAKNSTHFGNLSGQLGQNFMEHPHLPVGHFVITNPNYAAGSLPACMGCPPATESRFFRPSLAFQQEHNLLGCGLRTHLYHDQIIGEPIRAELAEISTLANPDSWRVGYLFAASEMAPNPTNRITLSDQTDALGLPKANLTLTVSEQDLATVRQTTYQFAQLLLRTNAGRCKFEPWVLDPTLAPENIYWGNHHIGSTKMAAPETDGVVDPNCRLFGTQNFYLAGSSVFTTGGYANPTLTIVQLALRLADHLQHTLSA